MYIYRLWTGSKDTYNRQLTVASVNMEFLFHYNNYSYKATVESWVYSYYELLTTNTYHAPSFENTPYEASGLIQEANEEVNEEAEIIIEEAHSEASKKQKKKQPALL